MLRLKRTQLTPNHDSKLTPSTSKVDDNKSIQEDLYTKSIKPLNKKKKKGFCFGR